VVEAGLGGGRDRADATSGAAGEGALAAELAGDRAERGDRAAQAVAAEHELADQVEQAIELVEVDADGLARRGLRLGRLALGGVGEAVDRGEADHRRGALDGVEIAEDVAEELAVAGAALDLEQLAGEGFEAFVRLAEEELDHVLVDGRGPREGGRIGWGAFG